jgi:2-methylcitrate dehydratase PrpD
LDFAKRVHLEFNPDLSDSSESRPSKVEVRLKDEKILSRHVEYAKGGPQAPLSAQEMRAKFVDCARRVSDEAAIQKVVEYIERLETLRDVGDLCALLAGEKR